MLKTMIDKPTETTNAIRATDVQHHLHPFTDSQSLNARGARMITRAEGVYLWDSEGERLIDGMAGLWCVNLRFSARHYVHG